MPDCCCCGDQLLRHIGNKGIYWVCPSCRQEMPLCHQNSLSTKPELNLDKD
jgi:hypothetical protein